MKESSGMNYCESMQRVLDYIETHLLEEITLDCLAKMAYLSKFHFHRVFQTMVGQPVMEYVRVRRLTLAGQQLRDTDRRIVDIAYEYQFSNHETFSRAFKKEFGTTPTECRRRKLSFPFRDKAVIRGLLEPLSIEPRVLTRDPFTVVGIEVLTSTDDNMSKLIVPRLWSEFLPRKQEIRYAIDPCTYYGLCVSASLETADFSYIACVEVARLDTMPEGMIARTLPASKYLVFTHKGSLNSLGRTYAYIYGEYFSQTPFKICQPMEFELYDTRLFRPDSEDSEFDIYIPIL